MTLFSTRAGFAAAGLLAALTFTAAACGDDDNDASSTSAAPAATAAPAAPGTAMADAAASSSMTQPFGSACSAVPTVGQGSVEGMADDPVATAASNNPVLSTLVGAVQSAGLVDTLNSAQDITVFAPANDAFVKVEKATLDAALADPQGLLTTVLTYHVVPGRLAPDALAGTHATLQGDTLTVAGSGEMFTVNDGAKVVCGNVSTANATVYIIDGLLLPPM